MNSLVVVGSAVKADADGDGRISGYLVRFGSPSETDLEGDFFTAETDFEVEDGAEIKLRYHHGFDSRIGKAIAGIGHVVKKRDGMWVEAQINMREEWAEDVMELVREGRLSWSSGTAGHLVEAKRLGSVRMITRWPLGLDASLTPTPAEPRQTTVMPLKSLLDIQKHTTAPQIRQTVASFDASMPLAEKGTRWEPDAAEARLLRFATRDEGETDWAKYAEAHLWRDEAAPDRFASYKLKFADVIGGKLVAVPAAIFAAAAVLEGEGDKAGIPREDVSALRSVLTKWYARMAREFDDADIIPPWEVEARSVRKALLEATTDMVNREVHNATWII